MTLQKVVPIASINNRLHLAIHKNLTQQFIVRFKHSKIWVQAALKVLFMQVSWRR